MTNNQNSLQLVEFYDKLYRQKQSLAMRPLAAYESLVREFNLAASRGCFLDVACGTGLLLKTLATLGFETYGVDISPEAVQVSQKNSPSSKVMVGRAEKLPFADNFFDYVSCLGSIEHFSDINQGIKELWRVAKTEAKFFLIVPNRDYFGWWFKSKKGTHQREIGEELKSLSQWLVIFRQNDLEILKVAKDNWPYQSLAWFYSYNPLKITKRLIFKIFWRLLPVKYTYQFIILAKKKNIYGS
ncbi:MAG: class I SAM-dependent methyltransferase [Candidatus Buchananbacteria bacterium]